MNGILKPALFAVTAVSLILLFACWQANAAECYPLNLGYTVDGDTVRLSSGEYIRLEGIDAPEMRGQCPTETHRAHMAKNALAVQLAPGRDLQWCPSGLDRYGRFLAKIYADGQDIGHGLVVDGLARKWTGSRESWCE